MLRGADGRRPFRLGRYEPLNALADSVEYLWSVEWDLPPGAIHEQEVLTYPAVHLVFEGPGVEVFGVSTRRFVRALSGTGRVLGVRFRPAGFSGTSRVPLVELVDSARPASEVLDGWPATVGVLAAERTTADAAAAAQRLLATHLLPPDPAAGLVAEALALIDADRSLTRVADLAGRLGTTVRTVQRRFETHLGVWPKWAIQRRRIHDALDDLQSDREDGRAIDWATLAVELGFTDQAHFTRVFGELVGVSPAAYAMRVESAGTA